MNHDVLCVQNSHPSAQVDAVCVCELIAKVRVKEHLNMVGVSSFEVGGMAYAKGREEAANAVKKYKVSSIPMFPGDTPFSLAERIKGLLGNAALCGDGSGRVEPKTLMEVFSESFDVEP